MEMGDREMQRQKEEPKTEQAVIDAVNEELKGTLTEDERQLLIEENYVSEVLQQLYQPSNLAARIRKLRGIHWGGNRHKQTEPQPPRMAEEKPPQFVEGKQELQKRTKALEVVLAGAADRDELVVAFRNDVLEGFLLTEGEVANWIREQAVTDGPPSRVQTIKATLVSHPQPFDDTFYRYHYRARTDNTLYSRFQSAPKKIERDSDIVEDGEAVRGVVLDKFVGFMEEPVPNSTISAYIGDKTTEVTPQHLGLPAYGDASIGAAQANYKYKDYLSCGRRPSTALRIPVAEYGVLDWLRRLSIELAHRNRWSHAQAAYYVITGCAPDVDILTTATIIEAEIPALSRITMDINPTESPKEVAERYSKVRGGRQRSMTDKHQQLAIFSATRPEDGETWEQAMLAWNELCSNPEWRYAGDQVRNFYRDCTKAQGRLLRGHEVS
jgi:hypothetical protein